MGAQGFVEVPWDEIGRDSILPFYGVQQTLPSDYDSYSYDACIEFPEFVPASREEIGRWNLEEYAGMLGEWPELSVTANSSRGAGLLDIGLVPIVEREGRFYRINTFKLVVTRKRTAVRAAGNSGAASAYTASSVLGDGRWYKIRVSQSGIHKLTRKALASMGFKDPSKVRIYGYGGALLPETGLENMTDDLPELPAMHTSDGILFYAKGPLSWSMRMDGSYRHTWNTFSEYGYYFLTSDDSVMPTAIPELQPESGTFTTVTEGPDYALYEKDAFSWFESGRSFYDSYDFLNGSSVSYPFSLDGVTAGKATVDVSFSSSGTASSTLEVYVNDTKAGSFLLPVKASTDRATVASGSFVYTGSLSGNDRIRLHHVQSAGVSGRLDYIRLNFQRTLELRGTDTNFRTGRSAGRFSFRIKSAHDAVVWNVGSRGVCIVPSSMQDGYCVTSPVTSTAQDEYVVFDPAATFPAPEPVGVVANQNLHAIPGADMIIIVPSSGVIASQAERLAEAHREHDGLDVAVVRAEEIYNEFSSGTPDATAYRRFVKMLYDRAAKDRKPRYLLLFGGGTWDNRMITPAWHGANSDDYLLCYESDNSISETKSYVADDYFGLLENGKGGNILTEKIDIGIGRFPVTTQNDAKVMVDKVIRYMENENAGEWQNSVLILGDDGDANIHMEQADELACRIASANPALNIKKIYWDAYKMEVSSSGNSYPSVRQEILSHLEKGALLVNYTGHGSPEVLSHELVLNNTDFLTMKSTRLPLWVTASCDISPFDAAYESIGVNALLNPDGGALAMFSTARTVFSAQNQKINMLFDDFALDGVSSIGDAVREAKVRLVTPSSPLVDYSENKLHYILLGDPALHLAVPKDRVVVDCVQSDSTAGSMPVARAGSKVTVSGHIENGAGVADGFNGVISPSVFDSERHIVTGNNAGAADEPFEYDDYDRLLYSGSDSVRSGQFSFTFPVPKDINYSNERGRIVLFALSDAGISAHGCSDGFLVGGTSSYLSADSLGPDISLYLNTPDFQYWDKVNSAPCLVAEISDGDGINSFGNGIGHDILLVVDNDPAYTFVLNGYYSSVGGDYRRGRVVYNIPSLPEGRHTLMLRAWDVLNNSSVAYLGFEVVNGLSPQMLSVDLTDNPVRERTSFVITHNRPGSVASVTIEVADTGGRVLLRDSYTDYSASSVSMRDWNICGDSGQRLQRGLYIYKVTLEDTDGAAATATGKFVVL